MRTLLLASFICSLIGLFFIIFLANHLEPNLISIKSIGENKLDSYVKVRGVITEIKETEGLSIFTIREDTASIKVVSYEKPLLMRNQKIEVIGKVVEYRGALEIEATTIKII